MHLRVIRDLVFIALGLLSFSSRAQDTWLARPSGTTANLWSVSFATNQWVAVGEQGTILTSPDGNAWTARSSGFPTRWLVGVGYGTPSGNGLWVIVGESGLILTSPDAINWTARRTSGTRINAVAWGNGTFVAADDAGSTYYSLNGIEWSGPVSGRSTFTRGLVYGAPYFVTTGLSQIQTTFDGTSSTTRTPAPLLQGAAYGRRLYLATGGAKTYTSRDAVNWIPQPETTAIGVQGATFFNNQFVAVGNAGGITTTFDGSLWADRTSGTTQTLLAIAASSSSAVAVGNGGTILQSPAARLAPTVSIQAAATTEAVGGNVAFSAVARGSSPLTYQWRKDSVDIAGATADTLFLPNVALAQSGSYSCIVTNAVGSAQSPGAALTVVTSLPPADPVDLTFTLSSNLNVPPRSAAIQPDGKVLIGGPFLILNEGQAQFGLARLTSTGALDPTFKPGSINPNSSVETIVVQPDGKILVGGSFTSISGVARNRVARLNADGSLDLSFVPGFNFTNAVTKLALTSGGRVLAAYQATTLVRLQSDGSIDSTWISPNITFGNIQNIEVQQDGRVVVAAVSSSFGGRGVPTSYALNLYRLLSTGENDPSFAKVDLNPSVPGLKDTFRALRILPDGRIMAAATSSGFDPVRTGFTIQRFTSSGLVDPSFVPLDNSDVNVSAVSFTNDGRTWLAGPFENVNGNSRNQLARLNSNGSFDSSFNSGSGVFNAIGTAVAASFVLPLDDGRAFVGGDFNRIDSTVRPYLARLNAQATGGLNAPTIFALDRYYQEVRAGEPIISEVRVTGSPKFLYTGVSPGLSSGSLSTEFVRFSTRTNDQGGAFFVSVTNSGGKSVAQYLYVRVIPPSAPFSNAPFILTQPSPVQTNAGRPISLTVAAGGSNSLTYQWFKNGVSLLGATSATLRISSPKAEDSGDYTVVIRNDLGFATSETVHLGVDESPRFVSIATRALAGRADAPLIAGFAVAGPDPKRVMIRASGPTLTTPPFNLPGALADPVLTVYDSAGTAIYTNDDWGSANDVPGIASAGTRLGAFAFGAGSADAAGILSLAPGGYTAVVTSKAGATGVALVEVYEDDNLSNRLVSLSSRAYVGTGSAVAIPGIVTRGGSASKKILVRAVGPGLAAFNVPLLLADPILSIIDSAGATTATNDNWETSANLAELKAATAKVTFPLAAGSLDAALLVSLPPGGYSIQIGGVAGAVGNVLIEVYEVP